MKKLYKYINFLLFLVLFSPLKVNSQVYNTDVFNKPYPEIIELSGQPDDFKFTTHIVNIKVPQSVANNWSTEIEKQYIQTLFNLIEDKDFIISNYDGFYFPPSIDISGAHSQMFKNDVANIGLDLFDTSSDYNSTKLNSIIRLEEGFYMRPKIVTHELMHQWNSFLTSAEYWLVDPSKHTGLVEQNSSCFENYRTNFEHVQGDVYSYRQWFSGGFVGEFEGYLAGLWDAPSSMRTLKNYFHDSSLPLTPMGDYYYAEVYADEIYDISRFELFTTYSGERIPNYLNSLNDYDAVSIVFSLDDFLNDDFMKVYHYASIVNEIEDPDTDYNEKYDEVFWLQNHSSQDHPIYGTRQVNPYHASFKNLKFHTRLFDETLGNDEFDLENNISFFPNPTSDYLKIVIKNNTYKASKVFSIQGKEVLSSKSLNIDISNLSNGLYFIDIETEEGNIKKKFIKK